jgi:hypothetical protein
MQSYPSISTGDTQLNCHLPDTAFTAVDLSQDACVLGLESIEKIIHTAAHFPFELHVDVAVVHRSSPLHLQCPPFCGHVPLVVDNSVAEQAVKPGNDAALALEGINLVDAFDERRLQDLFRLVATRHAPFDECEESPVILD